MKTRNRFFLLIMFGILPLCILSSCVKDGDDDKGINAPVVSTKDIGEVTQTSAKSGGIIMTDGGGTLIEKGVCWSMNQNPTISDFKIADSLMIDDFTCEITGLVASTTYYLRAYAINSKDTAYGNEVSFTTLDLEIPTETVPVIETKEPVEITQVSANCGGNVITDGGSTITSRGVCWGINPSPTILDSKTTDMLDGDSYTSSLSELIAGTTYYLRAYATNGVGTGYGEELSFSTLPFTGTVSDIEENEYKTIILGTQEWMAENLKVTKFNDGSSIPLVQDNLDWNNLESSGYCWYDNDSKYKNISGALYNWYAIESNKLCPSGWHVPTNDDWVKLESFLAENGFNYDGSISAANDTEGEKRQKIAKSLAVATGWDFSSNEGAVGNTDYAGKRNSSEFSVLPGGLRLDNGTFEGLGKRSFFWTVTQENPQTGILRAVNFDGSPIGTWSWPLKNGLHVRCLKD